MRKLLLAGSAVLALTGVARAADINIAVVQAMTGAYAFVGVPDANAIRMAADEINASGMLGGNTIKLQLVDTASDKGQAITIINRLGGDPSVTMVIGPTSTIEALAVSPVANEHKLPMFTTAISDEVLKSGPWTFKGTLAPGQFVTTMAEFAVGTLGVKRCAMVFNQQNEANVSQKNVFRDYIRAHGGTVTSENGFVGNESDFAAIATKIVSENPDCVHISGQAPSSAQLNIQLKQAGLPASVKIIGTTTEATQQFLDIAGAAGNGIYVSADFVPGGRDETGRKFVADYQKRYNATADNYAAVSYAMMQVTAQALKNSGPDVTRAKLRDALNATHDVPVIIGQGKFSIEPDRHVDYDVALMQVRDGKFVVLK